MMDLVGKTVVIEAVGTTYTGKLVEIGETEVQLEGEFGWIVVPMDSIISIKEA